MNRRIAVCFYGITRSLKATYPSIERNVLAPAREQGDVTVYCHFFQLERIENPRSREAGALDPDEHLLLKPDWLALEPPFECLPKRGFDQLKTYGDSWDDDFATMRNLVHQGHSLATVTDAALADGAETVVFVRPDLRYHDSLGPHIARALRARRPTALVPWWQPHYGMNDRFAIVSGRDAIVAYGKRVELAATFCQTTGRPLHAEELVAFTMARARIRVHKIGARASRVRSSGEVVQESFQHPTVIRVMARMRKYARALGLLEPTREIRRGVASLFPGRH